MSTKRRKDPASLVRTTSLRGRTVIERPLPSPGGSEEDQPEQSNSPTPPPVPRKDSTGPVESLPRNKNPFGPPQRSRRAEWWRQRKAQLVTDGAGYAVMILWGFANAVAFALTFVYYGTSADFATTRSMLGYGLPVARAAAMTIKLNLALLLLPLCRNVVSLLRRVVPSYLIPLDAHLLGHKVLGYAIAVGSVVHVGAHLVNGHALSSSVYGVASGTTPLSIMWTTGSGATGVVLTVILALMVSSSFPAVRHMQFEIFWFVHHLAVVFFILAILHGNFCFIKRDSMPYCGSGSLVWAFLLPSLVIFMFERVLREVRGRRETQIVKVIEHPSNVIEIHIVKPSISRWIRAGQYVHICCPELSVMQWHPFTLTSCPEEPYISIHMRVVGDWTRAFAKRLGAGSQQPEDAPLPPLPRIFVDGPFGSASEDVFKYSVAVLIGAGIGVTPFASILKSIWYRVAQNRRQMGVRRVHFLWICRDTHQFEWFHDVLRTLEKEDLDNFLHVRVYLTGEMSAEQIQELVLHDEAGTKDAVTGLRAPTCYGRPNFDQLFREYSEQYAGLDVGVFFCGPPPIDKELRRQCARHTGFDDSRAHFFYHKERF